MVAKTYHNKKHIRRFALIPTIILAIGSIFFVWSSYHNEPYSDEPTQLGVTFSTKYAKELGLDWRKVYIETLDDLQVRLYRIPVYWDEIEQQPNERDLSDIQWMMDEADKRGAKIMLAIGQRVPRWPECHPPEWTKNYPDDLMQQYELTMMEDVVHTFKDHPALYRWQVHNEPFFSVFGECRTPDEEFISSSIARVKTLDPEHKVMTTDSGELSTWARTSGVADVLGISMYRVTWNSIFGYFYYPLPPAYYTKKAQLISPWVDDVIVSELQVEPWVPSTILTTSLEEQFHSMDVARFQNNIAYVEETGFSEVLLWGVEWWYWLSEVHGDSSMWDEGRIQFQRFQN